MAVYTSRADRQWTGRTCAGLAVGDSAPVKPDFVSAQPGEVSAGCTLLHANESLGYLSVWPSLLSLVFDTAQSKTRLLGVSLKN